MMVVVWGGVAVHWGSLGFPPVALVACGMLLWSCVVGYIWVLRSVLYVKAATERAKGVEQARLVCTV